MTRLFVVDLDDTLLSSGAIPSHVAERFHDIISSGAPVVIATARGVRGAMGSLADSAPYLPLIALNGAVIVDPRSGSIAVETIAPNLIGPISQFGTILGAPPCLLRTDGWLDEIIVPSEVDQFTHWSLYDANYFKAHEVINRDTAISEFVTGIAKIVFCTTVATVEELTLFVSSTYPMLSTSVVRSHGRPGFAWLEVGTSTGTKTHAVSRVALRMECTMRDVVYYGNGPNDVSVMAAVGEAVAVANSDPEVHKIAHRVIGSAASGAVVLDLLNQLDTSKS
jgi:hydroxymethylpyrimidine pyrophosphatase-like HAD family hydrolase